ncbi:MAG: prepilin peptidase [Chloroflexota bacterium]
MLPLLWVTILGWSSGAIVNYLADVLPRTRTFSSPVCGRCGSEKSWVSLFWPTKCDQCQRRGTIRTWGVFVAGVGASFVLWFFPPDRLGYYLGLMWLVYFGLVVVIDLEWRLILHPVSLVGGVMALVQGIFLHGWGKTLLGGGFGFLVMLVFYLLGMLFIKGFSRIRGEESDQVALGFGDVNLAGVIGLLLGWPGVVAGLIIAILLGGIVSGLYLLVKIINGQYTAFEALPYGPFLVLSAVYLLYIT